MRRAPRTSLPFLLILLSLSLGLTWIEPLAADSPNLSRRGKIVVANRASGDLSVISVRTDQVVRTVPMPLGPQPPEPMYVVNTFFRNRVWVGDRANDRVIVFNGNTFDVEARVPAGAGVFHMATDRFGLRLWVINDIDDTATILDAIHPRALATVPMPADLVDQGAVPHDVKLSSFGFFAYVTFNSVPGNHDVVVMFNAHTGAEIARARVGKNPHVAFVQRFFSLSNQRPRPRLYVPCQDTNEVFVLDARTLDQVTTLAVPGAHGEALARNGRLYLTNLPGGGSDALWTISTNTNTIPVPPTDTPFAVPHNLALNRNGRKLYVTHSGATADKVTVYRVSNQSPRPIFLGEITVGLNPFGLGFVR